MVPLVPDTAISFHQDGKDGKVGGGGWSKDKTCYNCREKGHIARDCPNQKDTQVHAQDADPVVPPVIPDSDQQSVASGVSGITEMTGEQAKGIATEAAKEATQLMLTSIKEAADSGPATSEGMADFLGF